MPNLCLKPLFFNKKVVYRVQLIMMPSTKFIVLFQHLEQQLEGILDKYTKLLFQLVDSIG